jgi:hypothetical protein
MCPVSVASVVIATTIPSSSSSTTTGGASRFRHDRHRDRGDGSDHDDVEERAGVDIDQGGAILWRQGKVDNGPC